MKRKNCFVSIILCGLLIGACGCGKGTSTEITLKEDTVSEQVEAGEITTTEDSNIDDEAINTSAHYEDSVAIINALAEEKGQKVNNMESVTDKGECFLIKYNTMESVA